MDKSFNDDELSDIMKEIEALEQDFKEDEVKAVSPILEELAHLEEEVAVPAPERKVVSLDSKRSAPKAESKSSTSMSFKVSGDLALDLQFDIGGKTVAIEVTEAGLSIEMEGGMKFTVPVSEKSSFKKAV